MRGRRVAGTRIANMPSGKRVNQLSEGFPLVEEKKLTAPSPARVLENCRRDVRSDERVDDEGRGGESRDESTPLKSRDVRDDDGRQQLQAAKERSAMLFRGAVCNPITHVYPLLIGSEQRVKRE